MGFGALFNYSERYGQTLSLSQKAHLFLRRKLSRASRWDVAYADWRRAHPEIATRLDSETRTKDGVPAFSGPAGFLAPDARPEGLSIGIACHLFYDDLASDFAARFAAIPGPFRLVVTTDTAAKRERIAAAMAPLHRAETEVRVVPNCGRDIAPKIVGAVDLHRDCDLVLHVHGKKSAHASRLEGWREHILDRLLGDNLATILHIFATRPEVGMVAPAEFLPGEASRLGESATFFAVLAEAMGHPIDPSREWLDHPSGSMFWCRGAALAPLLDLGLTFEDFGQELRQYKGTLAHGVEFSYFFVTALAGYKGIRAGRIGDIGAPRVATTKKELDAQIDQAEENWPLL